MKAEREVMYMQAAENLKTVLEYLPQTIRRSICALPTDLRMIQEIRLRSGRPVGISIQGREKFLTAQGTLTDEPERAMTISTEDIARTFQAVCSYSLYSHERDLAEGFVTIRGGCRVGICGTYVRQGDSPATLRHISSLNFRIAGEFTGCAEQVWQQIGGENVSILVAGPVGSGKTTFLRDLCRLIGMRYRTAVIDERGELAAMHRGSAQHDVGVRTDVLDGCVRDAGILTALRVLTPEYIICDEISTQQDVNAVMQAAGCGVNFAASCHAGTAEDIYRRPVLRPLMEAGIFRYCILLGEAGSVRTVRRLAQR